MDWVNLILWAILLGVLGYLVVELNRLHELLIKTRSEIQLLVTRDRTTQHEIKSWHTTQKGPTIDAKGVITENPNRQEYRGARVGRIGRVVRNRGRKANDP